MVVSDDDMVSPNRKEISHNPNIMNQRTQKPATLQQRNNAQPKFPKSTVLPIGAIKGKDERNDS